MLVSSPTSYVENLMCKGRWPQERERVETGQMRSAGVLKNYARKEIEKIRHVLWLCLTT